MENQETHDGLESKIVLLGDSGVGKTSLVQRYCEQKFHERPMPTIGASFLSRTIWVEERRIKMRLWDTAGQEKFRSLAPMYYRDASVALIVFDVGNSNSFTKVMSWINELQTNLSRLQPSLVIAIIGNKIDSQNRQVEESQARDFAEQHGAFYFETSAKENKGVEEMFLIIAKSLLKNSIHSSPILQNSVKLIHSPPSHNPSFCC